MEKELRLKVGKRYVRRDGKISGAIESFENETFCFIDSKTRETYRENGNYLFGHHLADLISEYIEPTKDTVEVRKEFVMAAYRAACSSWQEKIRKELPELFKEKELVKGKWYTNGNGETLFLYDGNRTRPGFDSHGDWSSGGIGSAHDEHAKEADEEAVKSALIAEAKRRGLKIDTNMILPNGDKAVFRKNDKGMFLKDGNLYWHSYLYPIFENGKWAKVIETPKTELTLEQIAEKFGVKVENLRIKDKD